MRQVFLFLLCTLVAFGFSVETMDGDFTRVNPGNAKGVLFSFHDSIKDSKNAVVNIFTEKEVRQDYSRFYNDPYFRYFFQIPDGGMPESRIERSLGSGVIVSSDGFIITNNHVIEGADKVFVVIPGLDEELEAKIIGKDAKSDIAVIKVTRKKLPYVKFADSTKIQVGDIVFAIGNPFGVGETVTQGIVSALNKSGIGINVYENFIQTDAAINVGNSGGALIDTRGALVGINTAILSRTGGSVGIGFAIPANMVKKIAQDLVEHGKVIRGYLGVTIRNINPNKKGKNKTGAVVASVTQDSPADKLGLQSGDIITKINGTTITNVTTLTSIVGFINPTVKVKVSWVRDGKPMSGYATLTSIERLQKL